MNRIENVERIAKGEFYANPPSSTGCGMIEADSMGHLGFYAWLPWDYTREELVAFEQGISGYSILPTSPANYTMWSFGKPCRLTYESSWCRDLSTSEGLQNLSEYNGLTYVLMDNEGLVVKCGIFGLDKVFCNTFMQNYQKQIAEKWTRENQYGECARIERMNYKQIKDRSLSFNVKN